ncbi:hypothetical protein MTBPR1_100190 [Candidatus Terasakiella magnetica]|uniref:Uncharacterized protein n=1 Tax=Candidatus Terasakiella magnetica TaxID=1867952 RepID=A0A1C3RE53_9PROT|nr:hypothetical protein [Candidatus Terasakiella magnetica]SCA55549.1 hypothetical protein MTBPR1_100190 [Candidatus Terasakiella magnetica]
MKRTLRKASRVFELDLKVVPYSLKLHPKVSGLWRIINLIRKWFEGETHGKTA